MKWLSRFEPYAYALLRVAAGLLFAQHGAQKMLGLLGGTRVPLASLAGVAGVIELVAGLSIAIGLLTRPLAFIASGEMAVAYFMMHAPGGPFPVQNRGELAALYCFLFLYIATRGTGAYGLSITKGR